MRPARIWARCIPGLNRSIGRLGKGAVHFWENVCIFAGTPNGSVRMRVYSALLLTLPLALVAQQPAQTVEQSPVPAVGAAAPDFTIRGATRYGLLREPVKLSDFKGQTVVLAFFVRARTRG
jgi:hypothetical protein